MIGKRFQTLFYAFINNFKTDMSFIKNIKWSIVAYFNQRFNLKIYFEFFLLRATFLPTIKEGIFIPGCVQLGVCLSPRAA
ncbi:hypothetical protein BpHYR1_009776 [Brachionus plicatilis]|uniref:Uncharacterized protein n=1 Tax=Brachionus plicatilis TaxID=10195 RepID=A0A3M7T9U0_BRAPC|nr:hypothetical protein BpHYR1_009776 [Brachionus plicatilis]